MSIRQNVTRVLQEIEKAAFLAKRKPEEISLVAVTKNLSWLEMNEAYEAGCHDFGESRVQEVLKKMDQSHKDVRWHFIGKLQKNKINKILGRFTLIHSVDTPELAVSISQASLKFGVKTSILLESNTSGEPSKSGSTPDVWKAHFEQLLELKGITLHGLMTMAPLTEDEGVVRYCFSTLRHLRDSLQDVAGNSVDLSTLSMGMSNDFSLAIQEGATVLRLGSAIFSPKGG